VRSAAVSELRRVRSRGRLRGSLALLGPAFVACVAYVDPGNFATNLPALIVLAIGLDPTRSLVISQVVLSFGIPFALVPLVLLTRRADVMGALVNRRTTTVAAVVVAGLIIALNGFLVVRTVAG
jgi:Mn2+/Fe2+ NRAMP family transporter